MEMTFAPLSCTHVMQLATSAVEPCPSGPPSALQIDSGELNATPATPLPLFALAVIVPATCVPWPLSSAQEPTWIEPERSGIGPCDFAQSTSLPVRVSCVGKIPVLDDPAFPPAGGGNVPRPAASQPSGA